LKNAPKSIVDIFDNLNMSERILIALKAGGVHFVLSLLVAAFAAALVFGVWYPFPYRELMGGKSLFMLVVGVDIVCGPLLTMVLYTPAKSRRDLTRDLGVVAIIQLVALLYGLHTVMVARPVYLVFEVDRFNAVSAVDIDTDALSKAKKPWDKLPIWGPRVIAAREPKDKDEMVKSLDLSLKGSEPSVRPDWWQTYEKSRLDARKRAKPLDHIRKKYTENPAIISRLDKAIKDSGEKEDALRWLPLTSKRSTEWIVLISEQTGTPLSYAAIDGF
jgi:hypothetical protein